MDLYGKLTAPELHRKGGVDQLLYDLTTFLCG